MQPNHHCYVYLLHLSRPLSSKHSAQHYVGWAYRLDSRMQQHLKGRGSRFTQVANERGIEYVLAASWPGSRAYERKIKNRKNARRLCPICCAAHAASHLNDDLL